MKWSFYHVLVYLHVVGAVIWVGGILFLGFVAVPATRSLPPDKRGALLDALGRRFRALGYAVLVLLVVTGTLQAGARGATVASVLDGSFFRTGFGAALGIKLIFFALMVVVSALHDFYVGPASARALAAGGSDEKLRRTASWLARITALLALLVVLYATRLVR